MVNTAVGGNQAPVFDMDSYTFNISENVDNAAEVGTLDVSDNDGNKAVNVAVICECYYTAILSFPFLLKGESVITN